MHVPVAAVTTSKPSVSLYNETNIEEEQSL